MVSDPNDPANQPEARSIWDFLRRKPPIRHKVLVYKTQGCCLCDQALAVIARVRKSIPFDLEVTDITGDEALLAIHGNEVPVVFVNGTKRFFGKVDPVLFRRTLR